MAQLGTVHEIPNILNVTRTKLSFEKIIVLSLKVFLGDLFQIFQYRHSASDVQQMLSPSIALLSVLHTFRPESA